MLVDLIGGSVRSSLKRGEMDIDQWVALVEAEAENLRETLERQMNTCRSAESPEVKLGVSVAWHGHAEVEVFHLPATFVVLHDEDGEEYMLRANVVLSVWVD